MRKKPVVNLAASVQSRLLNLSRARVEPYNTLLRRFAIERLLYRLGQSQHRERFVLKGAMLFMLWTGAMHRPTNDLDLLAYGDDSPQTLLDIFGEISQVAVEPDGLTFDSAILAVEPIREEQKYLGWRLRITSYLRTARIPMQIDIGFGDAVIPQPLEVEFPTLLPLAAPRLRAYAQETTIAEKLHAMVTLGMTNSRMKDFYDLWLLAATFSFESLTLAQAIQATFQRRGTAIPSTEPTAFTAEFAQHRDKHLHWQAFLRRNQLAAPHDFAQVCRSVRGFLLPLLQSIATQSNVVQRWSAGGPWHP